MPTKTKYLLCQPYVTADGQQGARLLGEYQDLDFDRAVEHAKASRGTVQIVEVTTVREPIAEYREGREID